MFSNWSAASQKKVFLKGTARLISALSALLQHDDGVANRGRNVHLPAVASAEYTPRASRARPSKTGRSMECSPLEEGGDCSTHEYVQWIPKLEIHIIQLQE
ncbi:unnamed protein product [Pipistrellus nathusii]|uniref:Uncharacterized protein n=1 Tax=Pipistrellus nathusii TaxID=59473 RepID=A0ABN9Z2V5_PIPNA